MLLLLGTLAPGSRTIFFYLMTHSLRKPLLKIFCVTYCSHVPGFRFLHVILENFDNKKTAKNELLLLLCFVFITGVFHLKIIYIMKQRSHF